VKWQRATAGGGSVDPTQLAAYALKSDAASVEDLQDSQVWPSGTSGAAQTIALPPRLVPCRLAAVAIVNTGSGVGSISTAYWTVGLVKVVPTGSVPGTAPKLVRIVEKTTVAIPGYPANLPANPGEQVFDATTWSFANSPWYATDPDDPSNTIPPDVFQLGDHLRLTFTPTGTPGDWGPRAIACRWQPYEVPS
jgi:hypothetical protein